VTPYIAYIIGFTLGHLLGLIVGRSAYHKRSLARGGNIGTSPLILNEGRTIRGNGVDGPYQPKPGITPKPQSPPPRNP
jgi:hypothetical protein